MRIVWAFLGVILFCASSIACGDDDAPTPTSASAPQQASEAAQEPQQAAQEVQALQEERQEALQELEETQEPQSASEPSTAAQPQSAQPTQTDVDDGKIVLGDARPATLLLPSDADRSEPRPLILLLHGYSSNASEANAYFQFSSSIDQFGFGLLLPNGAIDEIDNRYWNATDQCCDLFGTETDDVGYITSLIAEAQTHATFDQVFAVGHSNGGFMAYRLACEAVDDLSGIVVLAGAMLADSAECQHPTPLSVLHIHGTEDELVLYDGGRLPTHPDPDRAPVPGALESIGLWADQADCDPGETEILAPINTDANVDGLETSVRRNARDCAAAVMLELWTIEGGGHVPNVWGTQFTNGILTWLDSVYHDDTGRALTSVPAAAEPQTIRKLPNRSDPDEPIPLVILLHGYGMSAAEADAHFGLSDWVDDLGFAFIAPQASAAANEMPLWRAEDEAYLRELILESKAELSVDEVFVIGYGDGADLARRLVCSAADGLTAAISLAANGTIDAIQPCQPSRPISLLEIHGTEDVVDLAEASQTLIEQLAQLAACGDAAQLSSIDIDHAVRGAETARTRFHAGCESDVFIERWVIQGAGQRPELQPILLFGAIARWLGEVMGILGAETLSQPAAADLENLVIGGDRPARLLMPTDADPTIPRPLILLLHGYSGNAAQADSYFGFSRNIDRYGFGLVLPNGATDIGGNQFWNATPECCDIFAAQTDDVSYFRDLVAEARQHASFDQVFAIGHSNGGFMAYRLACEEIEGLRGIVSLAGLPYADAEDCRAPSPLSVLQIHGDQDNIILYGPGRIPIHPDPDREMTPGAVNAITRWAERAGCDFAAAEMRPSIDTDSALTGDETRVDRWAEGCADDAILELWTIVGGGHAPAVWGSDFTSGILDWVREVYDNGHVVSG